MAEGNGHLRIKRPTEYFRDYTVFMLLMYLRDKFKITNVNKIAKEACGGYYYEI